MDTEEKKTLKENRGLTLTCVKRVLKLNMSLQGHYKKGYYGV